MEQRTAVVKMLDAIRVLPAMGAIGPRLSDIVFYDNMDSVQVAGIWKHKGSPLNSAAGWNTGRSSMYQRHTGQYAHKTRCEWSYTHAEADWVRQDMRPYYMSGAINGYTSPSALALDAEYGVFTLYGVRALTRGTSNSATNIARPKDLQRLIGPAAGGTSLKPHMRGVVDWSAQGFNGVLHDEAMGLAGAPFSYGGYGPLEEAGFVPSGQSAGFSYQNHLKGLYANDVAAAAARDAGAMPFYNAYGAHLIAKCYRYLVDTYRRTCDAQGVACAVNSYTCLPTEHPSTGFLQMTIADYGVSELRSAFWADSGDAANAKTDRNTGEDFATAATWVNNFGCAAYQMLTIQGLGKRNAVAFHPPIDWVPQPSSLNGPPPATAWTVPPRVKTQQRLMAGWALSLGTSPVVPMGVFDIFITQPTAYTAYSGYTGNDQVLWYGPVDDYKDLYQWVAQAGEILDDYKAAPQVLLVEPVTDAVWSPATGAAASTGRIYDRSVNVAAVLAKARVPFGIASVGGALVQRSLTAYSTSLARVVVKAAPDAEYTSAGAAIPSGSNVISIATLLAGDLTQYAPVSVTGERDTAFPLLVTPRVRSDGLSMTLHCLNLDSMDFAAGAGTHHESGKAPGVYRSARSGLVVTLKVWAWLQNKRPRVTWWSPEATTQGRELSALVTTTGIQIRLPALLEYAVVVLDFA